MTIVDARTHIGRSKNTSSKIAGDDIIEAMDRSGVDAAIVQPLPSAADVADYVAEHQTVIDLAEQHPGRIFGLACIPPQIGRDAYFEEARRYVEDLGFVGLKYHPLFHGGSIISTNAHIVYEAGRELGVSVSVHTGPGVSWSLPSLLIPIAKAYPEVTLIAVHSGGWIYADDALVTARECDNVLLDSSWQYPITLNNFLRGVGPGRVMMASDFPANLVVQRTLWDAVDVSEEDRAISLGRLAIETYRLGDRLGS